MDNNYLATVSLYHGRSAIFSLDCNEDTFLFAIIEKVCELKSILDDKRYKYKETKVPETSSPMDQIRIINETPLSSTFNEQIAQSLQKSTAFNELFELLIKLRTQVETIEVNVP